MDSHHLSRLLLCINVLVYLRHNITAPPLRGCVGHVTANAESVEYEKTLGVAAGCPVSLLVICFLTHYLYKNIKFDPGSVRKQNMNFETENNCNTWLDFSIQNQHCGFKCWFLIE